MYKLVCVAGKLRGQEYPLKNGDNVLGRDEGCEILFQLDGISKRHVTFSVTDDVVYIPQWGSTRSLNVGVASGIMMYEYMRQHGDLTDVS